MKEFVQLLLMWAGTGLDKVGEFFKTFDPEVQKLKDSTEQIAAKDLFPFFEKMVAREKQIAQAQTGMVALKEVAGFLGLTETSQISDIKGTIMALKQPSGQFVPVAEFNTLKAQLATKDAEEVVAQALSDGKITAAQKDWALKNAKEDPASFKAFLAAQPEIVALKDRPGHTTQTTTPAEVMDDTTRQVCKSLGISEADYKKYYQKEVK